MRFDLTDEQRAIKDAVHELCAARYDPAAYTGEQRANDTYWPELTKSGWTQLAVPHNLGGPGAGVLELALVIEELGYALAPATFLGNAIAGLLIASAQHEEQRRRWLHGIASGKARAAFGMLRREGDATIIDSSGAALLVLAGPQHVVVVDDIPTHLEPLDSLDVTRELHRLPRVSAEPLGGDLAWARDAAEVLLAAELTGVAQHALEMAVAHAKERQQFGRPIGAYQAVSHRCADMLVLTESARSAMLSAAWTADQDPAALPFAASVAKVTAAEAAWRVTTSALQVHGGVGFTWEHPMHLFMRRAAATSRVLGSVGAHLERIAELNGLGSREQAHDRELTGAGALAASAAR
jgi:alkylation response protein AidB-like acyl-CoA dehydrogenase